MPVNGFTDIGEDILDAAKDEFGESATYLPLSGGSFPITGMFSNQFEQVDPDTEVVVASNQVVLGVTLSDLPGPPKKGDHLIVRKTKWKVIDSQEDGVAGTSLFLHKVCQA